jgi:hypothetical protein
MQIRKEAQVVVCGERWDGRGGDHPQKGNWRMILMMLHDLFVFKYVE